MGRDYPSDWDSRRQRVYRRDNFECRNCGAKGGDRGDSELHAHHVVPKSKGGAHDISNLITLCKDCHNAIHGGSMAPSSRSTTSKNTSVNRERLTTEATFRKCPICSSIDIGVGSDDMEVYCNSCGLRLNRVQDGLRVEEIDDSLLEDGSPLKEASKYTLAEPAWLFLSDMDNDEEVDYQKLHRRSQEYQKNIEFLRNSKVPPAVLVSLWLITLIGFNLVMPPILAWGGVFILLIALALAFPKIDGHLKKLVFKFTGI